MKNNITKLGLKKRVALELNRRYHLNNKQLHPLQQLFWECTLKCNVHCRHCGSDCKSVSETPDMPLDDFLHVIDNSITPHVDPHKTFIIISGGEPLMRPDIERCGTELIRRGYPWGMVTNGLFLTKEKLDALMQAGLHSITVSIDGFEDDHNWLRGHKQSFERASEAIRNIAATPHLTWDVVTCVNKRTLPKLPAFKDYLISLGVTHWRLFSIVPMGRAANEPDLLLSNDEYKQMMDFIVATRQEGQIEASFGCEGFLGSYEGEVRSHLYRCEAGVSIASILIDGSISACTSVRGKYYQGNIYRDDFWDVWENRFQPYRDRSWMKNGQCANCKMWRYCEGNGMHLRREDGSLMFCHLDRLK
ncbi:MAG: TIGR04133 family radical SAM/SPASM protein [Bacteroidales bacterium]|nr:TIGR04133 family radical SAM/SPASM protein [Bacteroidales bacterium]